MIFIKKNVKQKNLFLKKAQASMEYLTVYVWAFTMLGALLAVASYFMISDPTIFVSEKCLSDQSFLCKEGAAFINSNGDYFKLILKNNVGLSINISNIRIAEINSKGSNCKVANDIRYISPEGGITALNGGGSVVVSTAEEVVLELYCDTGGFLKKDVLKLDLELDYIVAKTGYFPKSSTISLTTRVTDE